jgi:hypothetical protein
MRAERSSHLKVFNNHTGNRTHKLPFVAHSLNQLRRCLPPEVKGYYVYLPRKNLFTPTRQSGKMANRAKIYVFDTFKISDIYFPYFIFIRSLVCVSLILFPFNLSLALFLQAFSLF